MPLRIGDTIMGVVDDATGQHKVFDKVTEFKSGVPMTDAHLLPGLFQKLGTEYFKARTTDKILNAGDYWEENTLLTTEEINKLFFAAAELGLILYIPAGRWIFPEDWECDLGYMDITVQGDSTLFSVITSKREGVTHAIVPRVDLTRKMPFENGFVQVDVTDSRRYYDSGVLSSNQNRRVMPEWSAVKDAAINSYIKITDGVPSVATLADVKAAGLLTELDLSEPAAADPGIDGIYVVSGGASPTGGGYNHVELNQSKFNTDGKKVPVLLGTVLQRVGGIWSRLNYTRGLVTGGKIHVRHLFFDDCRFYCITPRSNPTDFNQANIVGRDYIVEHCKFRNVSRINGLDRWGLPLAPVGESQWNDFAGLVPGRYNHFLIDGYHNFENFIINNVEYSYVHTAAWWEIPPCRYINVQNLYAHDCYTCIEHILYNPYGVGQDGYTNEPKAAVWNNIMFDKCRKYSPTTGGYHLLRNFGGNNSFSNITVMDSTGIAFYAGGPNNRFTNCHVQLHVEDYGSTIAGQSWSAPEVFHLKGITYSNNNGVDIISGCSCVGGNMTPIDQKLRSSSLRVSGCEMSYFGYYGVINSTTDKLDRTLLYYINDYAKFTELATEVNGNLSVRLYDEDTVTARGIYVYYDRRRDIWRRWHRGPMTASGIIDRSTESSGYHDKDVEISGSTLRGYHLVKVATSAYDRIKMVGGTLETASSIVNATGSNYVNRVELLGVLWYCGINAPAAITTPNVKNFKATACTLYSPPAYAPIILFTDSCDWIDNNVLADTRYASSDLVALGAPATTAMAAINFTATGVSPVLKIKGGSIDAARARYGIIKFAGVKNIEMDGTEVKMIMPFAGGTLMTGGGGRRFLIVSDGADSIDTLTVKNLKVNGENVSVLSLILHVNAGELSINKLTVENNTAFIGKGLNKMVYISAGTVVVGSVEYGKPSDVIVDAALTPTETLVPLRGRRHVTANTSVNVNDDVITVDTSAGNVTITISPDILQYKSVLIKKVSSDSNLLTIQPSSGTIEGMSNLIYSEQWTGAEITATGANFIIR